MNMNQLEYFTTTVRERSYSSAAKVLYISPQAVSKAIGDLERELQLDLLLREGREVVPSEFGKIFYMHACELLHCFVDLNLLVEHHAAKRKAEGKVDVAITSFGSRGTFNKFFDLESFEATYPRIKTSVVYGESGSCLSALEEGVVDVAIILGRTQKESICCIKLFAFTPRVALSKKHPLADRDVIKLEELENTRIARPLDLRYCYRVITRQMAMHGFTPNYVEVPSLIQKHQDFIDSGDGVIFVSDDSELERMYKNTLFKPLCDSERLSIPISVAYLKNNTNKAIPWLESHLMETTGEFNKALTSTRSRIDTRKYTLATSGHSPFPAGEKVGKELSLELIKDLLIKEQSLDEDPFSEKLSAEK